MKILLDMDGVIADFVGGVLELFKSDLKHDDITNYCIHEKFDLSIREFWENIPAGFWRNLKPTKHMIEVLAILDDLDVCLLTSPTLSSLCLKEKYEWIVENLPKKYWRKFLIGPAKEFCASQDNILIDDNEDNCQKFVKAGGWSILFPAPWNSYRKRDPVRSMELCLKNLNILD